MKAIKYLALLFIAITYLTTASTLQSCKKDNIDPDNDCDTCVVAYKPNIYLYPTEKTQLTVNLKFPKGGKVIKSIPEYGKGWNASVDTNGLINDSYTYLFYESSQPDIWQREYGWTIKVDKLDLFFRKNLTNYGFKAHEIEDINLLISDKVMIFDNLEKTLEVVFYSNPNIENSYSETFSEIDRLIERLESQDDSKTEEVTSKNEITFKSNMNFEQYTKCIEKIKDYIIEGDVMQVVFAQERSADFDLPPFELYKSLRKLNPSPYMFFLDFGDYQLVGSSPEILVRLEHGDITVRPIAGTKPRG